MAEHAPQSAPASAARGWQALWRVEDWWAIWIGLGLVLTAVGLFESGASLQWLAVAPAKWHAPADLVGHFASEWPRYIALFVLWSTLFGLGAWSLGLPLRHFLTAFAFVYVVSIALYALGQWDQASRYSLEPPLVGLLLGLLISNTVGVPRWAEAGFRVEFYVKTGIVLLGAGLPFTLILWAGPTAILQAAIASLVTFGVIFFVAVRLGLDRRLAAVLGTGGAVCGVSGAIAVAGAVGAKKEHAPIAITLVVLWAIVMIFLLPLLSRAIGLPSPLAGAWIGTSEFADAAGFAAAQAYDGYTGHVEGITGPANGAVNAFTLMKVIGRDMWIGIWAFVLSIVATSRWDETGITGRARASEIWHRFPKFVVGFLLASAVVSLAAHGLSYPDYKKTIIPTLVAPIQGLRVWAFTFCFFSIGLTTRFRALASSGVKPFYAFTAGVLVNVVLGYVLSAHVFADFWNGLGR